FRSGATRDHGTRAAPADPAVALPRHDPPVRGGRGVPAFRDAVSEAPGPRLRAPELDPPDLRRGRLHGAVLLGLGGRPLGAPRLPHGVLSLRRGPGPPFFRG